jgi:hypothetical protein
MRPSAPERLEKGRVTTGRFASHPRDRFYGCFYVMGPCGTELKIIASEGDEPVAEGWEHVSVSTERRIPNWLEMCFVKDLFWSEDECVVQFHPPRAEYVNQHPNCLHLWKNTRQEFPLPPSLLVGVKDMRNPSAAEVQAIRAWGGK